EEFLVVLFNSDREQTSAYCDRLHQRIKASTNEGPLYTVSIGVAQLTEDQIDQPNVLDTLIKQADQALYQAKANGRNRTTFFEQAS
ncbi:diguanylate cyclase, partial [Oleiphilus sp. HI0080]